MSKKQKDIFLEFEGDIYFERNNLTIQNQEIGPNDPIIFALSKLIAKKNPRQLTRVNKFKYTDLNHHPDRIKK